MLINKLSPELLELSTSFLDQNSQLNLAFAFKKGKEAVYNQDLYRKVLVASHVLIDEKTTCKDQVSLLEKQGHIKVLFAKAKVFYEDEEKTYQKLKEVDRLLDLILSDPDSQRHKEILNQAKLLKANLLIYHKILSITPEKALQYLIEVYESSSINELKGKAKLLTAILCIVFPVKNVHPELIFHLFSSLEESKLSSLDKAICTYYQSFCEWDKQAKLNIYLHALDAFTKILNNPKASKGEIIKTKVFICKIQNKLHRKISKAFLQEIAYSPFAYPIDRVCCRLTLALQDLQSKLSQNQDFLPLYDTLKAIHDDPETNKDLKMVTKFHMGFIKKGTKEGARLIDEVAKYKFFSAFDFNMLTLISKLRTVEAHIYERNDTLSHAEAYERLNEVQESPLCTEQDFNQASFLKLKMISKNQVSVTSHKVVIIFNAFLATCSNFWQFCEAFSLLHHILLVMAIKSITERVTDLFVRTALKIYTPSFS